jgi:anti-sigma factor RsiW
MNHKHTPQCKALLAQLSGYIDGELEEKLCAKIEQHLANCTDCQVLVDTTQKTIILFRRQPQPNLPAGAIERLWRVLEDEGCISSQN